MKLGKPMGTIQASKFDKDKDRERIEELLRLGMSVRKIAIILGYSTHIGLNTYVNKRHLRKVSVPSTATG
jgi:putative DNA-invertase from lambdoid prophage Rac